MVKLLVQPHRILVSRMQHPTDRGLKTMLVDWLALVILRGQIKFMSQDLIEDQKLEMMPGP